MSDLPPGPTPDLHAILGLDRDLGEQAASEPALERVVVERVEPPDFQDAPPEVREAREDLHVAPEELHEAAAELHGASAQDESQPAAAPRGEVDHAPAGGVEGSWSGITRPSRVGSSRRFLTDVIVEMGFVSRHQVDEAIELSRTSGTTPERVLLEQGVLNHDALSRALAERYGLDHLDLGTFKVDMAAANLVTATAAKRYQAVPVAFVDKSTLLVAMADPANVLAVDDMAIMTGYEVRVAVAPPEDIAALITRQSRLEDVVGEAEEEEGEPDGGEVVNLHASAEEAPAIKFVNQIVAQAVERRASDVHLAAEKGELRVRFRVDGVLQEITTVPRRMASGVVSRVKIMAD